MFFVEGLVEAYVAGLGEMPEAALECVADARLQDRPAEVLTLGLAL